MPSILFIILLVSLLYTLYKQDTGAFICFFLLFYKTFNIILYSVSSSLYEMKAFFWMFMLIIALLIQFNYFNKESIVRYYKNPVVISTVFVYLLMLLYNAIGPYYDNHQEAIICQLIENAISIDLEEDNNHEVNAIETIGNVIICQSPKGYYAYTTGKFNMSSDYFIDLETLRQSEIIKLMNDIYSSNTPINDGGNTNEY